MAERQRSQLLFRSAVWSMMPMSNSLKSFCQRPDDAEENGIGKKRHHAPSERI
jgi:hypothetical protein